MKDLRKWLGSFSKEHRMLLFRDFILSIFIGTSSALLPIWVYADTLDKVVIGIYSMVGGLIMIISTDKAIENLVKEEKKNARRKHDSRNDEIAV